jgi:hypothetical protein
MNIQEFFEQSAGKWFTQRTSHHLASKQAESGKSNITIEILPADTPEVVKLCHLCNIDPGSALCGARVVWDSTIEWNQQKNKGSTVVVPIPDPANPQVGLLLREMSHLQKNPVTSRYILGSDDALTIITEHETIYSEERLWFASPNLRLRTSILKQTDGFSMASLSSEIRMGITQAPKKAEDAATSL